MKKVIAFLVLAVMIFTAASCTKPSDNSGDMSDYARRKNKITFSYYAGGYGADWVNAVAKDYMDNVDTELYIEIKKSSDNTTAKSNIESNVGIADLYQIEADMFDLSDSLEDLTDFYENTLVYGENVKIKDKMPAYAINYYNENGRYYQLPQTAMTGFNWVYNKTLLDKTFGKDKYVLPKTTNEMLEFGAKCFEKGVFLTAAALADTAGGDYTQYALMNWFAQMTGLDGWNNFNSGLVERDGKLVLSEAAPYVLSDNKTAIESTYKFAEKLYGKAEGNEVQYLHKNSKLFEYKDLDKVFYGGKFRAQTLPGIAMCYVGGWLETEVKEYFEEGVIQKQEVYAIPSPVISDIVKTLENKNMTDAELSQIIGEIDGGASSSTLCSQNDFDKISEARHMVTENICRCFVIPKGAKNKTDAKKFLAYLVSDNAQKIAAKNTNGISVLPYGYLPTDSDMGFAISDFTKSVNKLTKNDKVKIVDSACLDKPFKKEVNIMWFYDIKNTSALANNIYAGTATGGNEIYQMTYDYYNGMWKTLIEKYKKSVGIS